MPNENGYTDEFTFKGIVDINYFEGQKGGIPLLMIHGGADRWQSFKSIIPELCKKFHVYAIDLRGHGKSGWGSNPYTLSEFVTDLELFVEAKFQEPPVIFGHSLGGMIGLLFAAKHPYLLRSLILGDTPLNLGTMKNLVSSQKETANRYIQWLRNGQKTKILDETKNEFLAESLGSCDPEMLDGQFNHFDVFFGAYQVDELLPLVQCPVLVVRGVEKLGSLISDENMAEALKWIPQLKQTQLAGEGHSLFARDERLLLNAIDLFIFPVE